MAEPVVKEGYGPGLEKSQWFNNNIKPNARKAVHYTSMDGGIVTLVRFTDKYGRDMIAVIKHAPTGYIVKVMTVPVVDKDRFIEALRKVTE